MEKIEETYNSQGQNILPLELDPVVEKVVFHCQPPPTTTLLQAIKPAFVFVLFTETLKVNVMFAQP